jgi:hypothetical protein
VAAVPKLLAADCYACQAWQAKMPAAGGYCIKQIVIFIVSWCLRALHGCCQMQNGRVGTTVLSLVLGVSSKHAGDLTVSKFCTDAVQEDWGPLLWCFAGGCALKMWTLRFGRQHGRWRKETPAALLALTHHFIHSPGKATTLAAVHHCARRCRKPALSFFPVSSTIHVQCQRD